MKADVAPLAQILIGRTGAVSQNNRSFVMSTNETNKPENGPGTAKAGSVLFGWLIFIAATALVFVAAYYLKP